MLRRTARPSAPSTNGGELPELLTAEEVAAWLKISLKAVYARSERGGLPGATRIGRRLYFFQNELLRSLEQGRVPHLGATSDDT